MRGLGRLFAAAALALAGAAPAAAQQPAQAEISLWRLDCGEIHVGDLDDFSDAYLYEGQAKTLTDSCYLIRHPGSGSGAGDDRYLLWDSGLPGELAGRTVQEGDYRLTLRERIRDQLARIRVRPEQVNFVGISHYHDDHVGQVADFPQATLLIGAADWEAIRDRPTTAARFGPWIEGGGTVEAVVRDHDVFGDGSVVLLDMPGHTPGHHSLLVRLRGRAPVLLTGDLFHFTEQVSNGGVPRFNTNRADTLASIARFLAIADSLEAEMIIQHEPADVARLPAFPEAAH
jgi:glyoxylase-like metal-dependent hydrolase (beta-lactamase superfamily II)